MNEEEFNTIQLIVHGFADVELIDKGYAELLIYEIKDAMQE